MLKKIAIFLLFFGCLFCSAADAARILIAPRSLLEVEIHGDDRGRLPLRHDYESYQSEGFYRVEAKMDERYQIVVRNNSSRRLGLVVSIDGLNIISGKTSYHRPTESMYLLEPGQSGSFSGWRRDYDSVQRFYFTDSSDSYAARTGQYGERGWIKVAVFQERQPIVVVPKRYDDFSDSEKRMSESLQAGTGYGERKYSPVETADFNSESFPVQMLRIKYDFPNRIVTDKYPDFAEPPR